MVDRQQPSPEDVAGPAMSAPHTTPSLAAPTVSSPTTPAGSLPANSPSPVHPDLEAATSSQEQQSRGIPEITVAGPSSETNHQYATAGGPIQQPPRSFSPVGVNENTPFTASYPPYQAQYPPQGQGVPPPGGYYGPQAATGGYAPVAGYPYAGAAVAAADNKPKTFAQRMAGSDEHWQWKLSLRVVLIVLDIIAIGAAAAVTANNANNNGFYSWYYFDDSYILPFTLIPLGVSFVWCLVVVLVLLLRKPPRAVHPGIAVGLDLVLWLAFIFTLLFTVSAVLSLHEFGDSPSLDAPYYYSGSYGGGYSLAPNNSWVWTTTSDYYNYYNLAQETGTATVSSALSTSTTTTVATAVAASVTSVAAAASQTTPAPALSKRAKRQLFGSSSAGVSSDPYSYDDPYTYSDYDEPYSYDDPYDSYSTDSDGYYIYPTTTTTSTRARATITRDCTPEFTSCAQQDAFVNKLWHDKDRRYALDMLVAIIQGIAIVLHFALFVWACVDTHRRNRMRRTNAMTMDVLQDMRQRGYVMVPAAEGGANAVPVGAMPGRDTMYSYPPAPAMGQEQWQGQQGPVSPRAAEKAPVSPVRYS